VSGPRRFWPRHAFWQAVALTVVSYLALEYGIAYLPRSPTA